MRKNDVTVYVGKDLDSLYYEEICDSLLNLDGILAAVQRDDEPHLMTVEYDPYKLNSLMILGRVRCFAQEADFGPN